MPFRLRDQLFDRGGKGRKVFRDDVPGRCDVGALIFVAEQVADCGDLTPGNAGGLGFYVRGNVAAGFGDDLQPSFHGALHSPAFGEGFERGIVDDGFDSIDSILYVQ